MYSLIYGYLQDSTTDHTVKIDIHKLKITIPAIASPSCSIYEGKSYTLQFQNSSAIYISYLEQILGTQIPVNEFIFVVLFFIVTK